MSPDLENQVMNAVQMYQQRPLWKKWGMHTLRKQGAAILLEGPPGCGKTKIAEYLSLQIRKKGMKELSFGDFGSHVPGENARQIRALFEYGKDNGDMTLYLNECEAILWDRSRAGGSAMWMLEVIDELLVQIEKYPGLIIMATNKPELLDSALERRLIARIYVGIPEYRERVALWKNKMPNAFPLKLTPPDIEKLAKLILTGAEIETAIIQCASDALRAKKPPKLSKLYECAKEFDLRREAFAKQAASTTIN